ncbi:methyltransferase [Streptomyces clavuligerus]|uniref:methyltransferase n=1 Tax=Streptomyces clavuligerus TaxID=1901 RepID=UPI0005D20761|nr:methyltransferase [Streptomyces clavuligerus]QCS10977.1 methyltransferase [Streptomyces clavuligerus]QPJ98424.1 methyltransferase [Streptomyces clavuligerus]
MLINQIVFGGMAAQTLRAADRLNVVELIGEGPRPAADVAAAAGAEPRHMTRLLRALAGLGLLKEHTPGTFSVTPAGRFLDPRRPDSVASLVRMLTDPLMLRAWEHLDDSVRTGDTAFEAVFGTDFFGHLARNPELSAEFNAAMSQATRYAAAALPHAFDFSRFTTVTDVGGGDGTLLAAVLDAHPGVGGVVYDTADGLAQTRRTLRRHGLLERCSTIAGDFFQSVPGGSDLYLMKSVLHDWPDDRAVTILRHCRAVLPPDGRVLIVEPVLPDVVPEAVGAPGAAVRGLVYLSDLNMMVNVGGRERTRRDFEELCGRAGLRVVSSAPLAGATRFSLVEAAPGE